MRVVTSADLGNLVREARLAAGLTQDQLAQRAGASRLWVNQVERGHEGASLGKLLNLLAALDLAMDLSSHQRTKGGLEALRERRVRNTVSGERTR